MKAFIFEAPSQLICKEVDRPVLSGPFSAVLSPVVVAPCTSDVHTVFEGGVPKQKNHILGHECVAHVEEVGTAVKDFKVGDIVAVPAITPNWRALAVQEGNDRHAGSPFSGHQLGRTKPGVFAEFFSVDDADTTLAHIPNNVTLEQALMAVDVMTTGLTAVENANIKFGDTVCIFGIGAIGLMSIAGTRLRGAAHIIGVGTREICIKVAQQYGVDEVLSYKQGDIVKQILDKTNGIGVDSVIIAGGGDEVFTQAVDIVKYGIGTISNVNYYGGTGSLSFPKFSGGRGMAGKTINTNLAKGGRVRIERMLKLISSGRIDPAPLVTHRFYGLQQISDAMLLMKDKPADLIKAVVYIDKF